MGQGKVVEKYQPGSARGTRSPPATPHCLQHLTTCLIYNCKEPCVFYPFYFIFDLRGGMVLPQNQNQLTC